jgi:hypothetical protein
MALSAGSGAPAPKRPSGLASFSEHWVGGDPDGISVFASHLYGLIPKANDIAGGLSSKVTHVDSDAGWTGAAANAFTQAWDRDFMLIEAHMTVISEIGDTADTLAMMLAQIEHDLEEAAAEARAKGVPIPADGAPPPTPYGPYSSQAQATAASYANSYRAVYQDAMSLAARARADAVMRLSNLIQAIGPGGGPVDLSGASNAITVGDYLRGLWAVPSAYSELVGRDLLKAKAAAHDEAVRFKAAPPDNRDVGVLAKARTELADVRAAANQAENIAKKTGAAALDVKVSDVFKGLSKTGADLSAFDKWKSFAGDLPVIDVIAAGGGTVLSSISDIQGGMNPAKAIAGEAAGNAASLAAGAESYTVISGLTTSGLTVAGVAAGAPIAGVIAGAAFGGVVAVGVGDVVHEALVENWSADIHNNGVIMGVLDGSGHTFARGGEDLKNTAVSVWHGVTSIF